MWKEKLLILPIAVAIVAVVLPYCAPETMCEETVIQTMPAQAAETLPPPEISIETETAPEMVAAPETVEPIEHEYYQIFAAASDEDKENVSKICYLEADMEGWSGEIAVIEVIANRAISEYFTGTFTEVVSAKGQFTTWKSVKRLIEGQPYKPYGDPCVDLSEHRSAYEYVKRYGNTVIADALYKAQNNGTVKQGIYPTDYVYFCTKGAYKSVGHKYMHNCITIGNHVFGTVKK